MRESSAYGPVLIFLLALLILYPFLFSPFVTLDSGFHTSSWAKALNLENTGQYPFDILHLIFGNASMFLLLLAAFLCAYYFIRKISPRYYLLITLFYVINPFVYMRLLSGQLGMIVGYCLLPGILSLGRHAFQGNKRAVISLALLVTLSALFQPHFLFLDAIVLAVIYFHTEKRTARSGLWIAGIVLLLNLFWIQQFIANNITQSISSSDAAFFAPKLTQGVPTIVKVIGMWGFWRENAYITTYTTLPLWLWYFLTLTIFGTFLIGYYATHKKRETQTLFVLWWIGVILAAGISHPYTRPLFNALFNYMPFFSGFRDSNKFVALVGLAYAFLCPVGVMWLAQKGRKNLKTVTRYTLLALFILIILVYTYPILSIGKQIHPLSYPRSYDDMNAFLKDQNITGALVYIPYYDYLTYNWSLAATSDGRIANPINAFVTPTVITDPGPWGLQTSRTRAVGKCINERSSACLEEQGVQFVLVDKCFIDAAQINVTWLEDKVHSTACVDTYALRPIPHLEKKTPSTISSITCTIISLITIITCVVYLIANRRGSS